MNSRLLIWATLVAAAGVSGIFSGSARAAEPDRAKFEKASSQAIAFLKAKGQAADGSFSAQAGTGITSLVATAMLRHGVSPDDAKLSKSLKYLEAFIQKDGGIYSAGSTHRNYETCLAVMAFDAANKDGRYAETLKRARGFLEGLQWDEGEGKESSDTYFGGAGYGGHKRPDLSNTTFLIDALKAAGADSDDEAMKKALTFVSRCQNLETEHNTTPFATKNPDGGFYYTPAAGGTSQAGMTEVGGLRSYGSMTYAGLKSMIFAGVKEDDPRVKAAITWLSKNYDLESNPGMGNSGLYYYYHTFAKSLDALGQETFVDKDGETHHWRADLVAELSRRQRKDGSWLNENERWLEGDANLVTGYALLALSYCKPK